MDASTDWSNLTLGGAFLVGAILATIATIRIFRVAAEFFTRIDKKEKKP